MPNSWSNSSILSPNRSILHRVYLVFDKWTDSGPDFSVFPESDLSTFIAWSGAHEGNGVRARECHPKGVRGAHFRQG